MASRSRVQRDDSHVYYNATLHNDSLSGKPINASYSDPRSDVLIENPSDWHMSIIRINLPSNIPIFIFKDNRYYVTLTYNSQDFTQVVTYITSDSDPTVRSIYNYQYFIDSINNAFLASYNALITTYPSAPPLSAPKMIYDPLTSFFYFNCDDRYDPIVAGAPTIEIWMNIPLFYKFEAFKVSFNNYTDPYKNFQIQIQDNIWNRDATNHVIKMYQEVPSLGSMDDYQYIVITSNTLPTRSEYLPLSTSGGGTSSSTFQKIITDFAIPTGGNATSGASSLASVAFQYLPTAEYRLLDLTGNNPITNVDFNVYLQDKEGVLTPFPIEPGHTMNVKILFRKKELALKGI